jgi:uncharacterized integral membrane protein (TIGR00698 family)
MAITNMSKYIYGIIFSTILGAIAFLGAPFVPLANSIVLALLLGIIITNIIPTPKSCDLGIKFSSKTLLEIAIIFMGFGISFQDIAAIGYSTLGILVVTIIIVLVSTLHLSKVFSCRASTGYLVGFGTAICGSSAIAALAPSVVEDKKQAGIAIAVVNLFGLLGMVVFPLIFHEEMLFDTAALLIGGTLHGVSNVAGAGYAMDEVIGDLAITIKLGRVALLAPALIFFNFLVNKNASVKDNLKLPYYIIGFILATASVTFINISPDIIIGFRTIGKVLLTISMAAIGLNIRFNELFNEGKIAMGFGAIIFAIQVAVVGAFAYFI